MLAGFLCVPLCPPWFKLFACADKSVSRKKKSRTKRPGLSIHLSSCPISPLPNQRQKLRPRLLFVAEAPEH
jgi:hypothetical protein